MESKSTGPVLTQLRKLAEAERPRTAQIGASSAGQATGQVIELKRGQLTEAVSLKTSGQKAEKTSYLTDLNERISAYNMKRSGEELSLASESEVNNILADLGKALRSSSETSAASDPLATHNLDVERALELLKE